MNRKQRAHGPAWMRGVFVVAWCMALASSGFVLIPYGYRLIAIVLGVAIPLMVVFGLGYWRPFNRRNARAALALRRSSGYGEKVT